MILSALLLFLHNKLEDRRWGRAAAETLTEIQTVIDQRTEARETMPEAVHADPQQETVPAPTVDPRWEDPANWPDTDFEPGGEPIEDGSGMPVVTLSEINYIGVISIPALGLELPVMSPGNYDHLDMGPICQFGSPATGDMVIAAHNTNNFFGKIDSLRPGDPITFTDVNGRVYNYVVSHGELLQVGQVSEARNNGYPLGLYTCAYDGTLRFIVLCDRA